MRLNHSPRELLENLIGLYYISNAVSRTLSLMYMLLGPRPRLFRRTGRSRRVPTSAHHASFCVIHTPKHKDGDHKNMHYQTNDGV